MIYAADETYDTDETHEDPRTDADDLYGSFDNEDEDDGTTWESDEAYAAFMASKGYTVTV